MSILCKKTDLYVADTGGPFVWLPRVLCTKGVRLKKGLSTAKGGLMRSLPSSVPVYVVLVY